MLCDKHIPKMLLESAQLLCTLAHHYECDGREALYKPTHTKHPCQLWLRESHENWAWLWAHVVYMDGEYSRRFNKPRATHKSFGIAQHAAIMLTRYFNITGALRWDDHTPFVQCMPEQYRIPGDAVTAYRRYYAAEKSYFAKWERGTPTPQWFTDLCSAPNATPAVSNPSA